MGDKRKRDARTEPRQSGIAPRLYNPLEDFHLYPLVSAAVFGERRVYACDMPMVLGVANKRGRVFFRRVWWRARMK